MTTNSEHIQSLHPALQLRVWGMIGILATQGISIRVLFGFRDRALQKELYDKWKAGKGGKAAKPGLSFHNYGLACDMVPYTDDDHDLRLDHSELNWNTQHWTTFGRAAEEVGLL